MNKVNADDYEFHLLLPASIIFGSGAVKRIGSEAKRLQANKVCIVTSRGMLNRGCVVYVVSESGTISAFGIMDTQRLLSCSLTVLL